METLNPNPCIKQLIVCLLVLQSLCSNAQLQLIPEFNFSNPVLVSGSPNKDGAVYRFYNIATGYDATVKILGRSSTAVTLDTIDLSPTSSYGMGYEKALQPHLGINGTTPANSNWWMKFQIDFLVAGKNSAANIAKFKATAIDVDGDSYSVAENVKAYQAISAGYATQTYLSQSALVAVPCPKCGKSSLSVNCPDCSGTGTNASSGNICSTCKGAGLVFSACGHPYTGQDISVQGPVANAPGIDTISTGNMVTFTYVNTSSLIFQYGGVSTASSNGGGMRLNSLFLKAFSLSNSKPLPIELISFNAKAQNEAVDINWSVASGIPFAGFEVERSIDGLYYSSLHSVTMSSVKDVNFTFNDHTLPSSTSVFYYRLKMIHETKEITYSAVKKVEVLNNTMRMSLFPNPCLNEVSITLPVSFQHQSLKIEILSSVGTLVRKMEVQSTDDKIQIRLGGVASGMYYIRISNGTGIVQRSLLKS